MELLRPVHCAALDLALTMPQKHALPVLMAQHLMELLLVLLAYLPVLIVLVSHLTVQLVKLDLVLIIPLMLALSVHLVKLLLEAHLFV